jgi:hypothetical protein
MAKQQERSKEAHTDIDLMAQTDWLGLAQQVGKTEFLGYSNYSATAKVVALLVNGAMVEKAIAGEKVQVLLDRTPFYGESGGQVGDRGYLSVAMRSCGSMMSKRKPICSFILGKLSAVTDCHRHGSERPGEYVGAATDHGAPYGNPFVAGGIEKRLSIPAFPKRVRWWQPIDSGSILILPCSHGGGIATGRTANQ